MEFVSNVLEIGSNVLGIFLTVIEIGVAFAAWKALKKKKKKRK